MTPDERSTSQPLNGAPETYPMPSFVTLAVRSVASSLAWYRDILNFQVVMAFGGPDSPVTFAHLRWVKFADLLLRAGNPAAGAGMTISYQMELERIDTLAERARTAGATILHEPGNRPWNARDFALVDPDGYQISFTWCYSL